MIDKILEEIDSLPPLPKTVIEVNKFRESQSKEISKLIEIIEKDPLIVATLLKMSNSAMFGFRNRVETVGRAVNLLGINFTVSIIICTAIQNILKNKLFVYGIDEDKFMYASTLSIKLVSLWLGEFNPELKEELILPVLLQESAKYVLSNVIYKENKTKEFRSLIAFGMGITEAENKIVGTSTSKVTAKMFKYWKLSDSLIDTIENVDDLESCKPEYLEKSEILQVIKTICSVNNPFCDDNIKKGIEKANEYKLDTSSLKNAIEKVFLENN